MDVHNSFIKDGLAGAASGALGSSIAKNIFGGIFFGGLRSASSGANYCEGSVKSGLASGLSESSSEVVDLRDIRKRSGDSRSGPAKRRGLGKAVGAALGCAATIVSAVL